jgi:hypothetical protein
MNSEEREGGHVLKTARNYVASVSQTGHPGTDGPHYQLTFALLYFHILCQTNSSKLPAHNNLVTLNGKIITECEKINCNQLCVYQKTSQSLQPNNIFS